MFIFQTATPQSVKDSGIYLAAEEKAIEEYLHAKNQNLFIYNGIQHLGYLIFIEGSPYYKSSAWEKGIVLYDDILYKNVQLKYDMVTDEVIILQPINYLAIILFSPRVNYFSFSGSNFIYLHANDSMQGGFYEQLATGKINLLAKRKSLIEEKITSELIRRFIRKDQFYIRKDNQFHAIENEKDVLNLLGGKKKLIKQYLKNNKIKFNRNRELALVKIAEQYNQTID